MPSGLKRIGRIVDGKECRIGGEEAARVLFSECTDKEEGLLDV